MSLIERIKNLPPQPGVYRFLDVNQKILYIGKAKNLKNRVKSYLNTAELSHRIKRMMSQAVDLDFIITQSELEALILESNLVAHLQPVYNILLKDDKSYAFIRFEKNHDFPAISKFRGMPSHSKDSSSKDAKKERFFGPYPQLDDIIETVQKVFKIRNCSDYEFSLRRRPCLQYDIKRCTAPCVNYVTKEDYAKQVKKAIDFLEGNIHSVIKDLTQKMQCYSESLEFEKAADVRNILRAVKVINERQKAHIVEVESADILYLKEDGTLIQGIVRFHRYLGSQIFYLDDSEALEVFITQFYKNNMPGQEILVNQEVDPLWTQYIEQRQGIKCAITFPKKGPKKRLLDFVALTKVQTSHVKLQDVSAFFCQDIKRIEAYDNSHLFGEHAYGVMVVFSDEGFEKKSYRKFKVHQTNDYDMMEEVITRRLKHEEWPMPDFMLIDGGTALVRMVKRYAPVETLVLGMAKGQGRKNDRLFDEQGTEIYVTDTIKSFLQNVRDEAHRFAIRAHREKREKTAWKSAIDQIPGIGLSRKKLLLQHFGSVEKIALASLEELTQIKGISKALAQTLYCYFHAQDHVQDAIKDETKKDVYDE